LLQLLELSAGEALEVCESVWTNGKSADSQKQQVHKTFAMEVLAERPSYESYLGNLKYSPQ